jgi:tetratricopeptide (TPR) repeat protein
MANMIALHEGRLTDLQNYLGTTLSEFPDPTFSNRLIVAIYGEQVPHIFVPMFSAAGSVVLGQYEQVIADTQAALAINDQLPDMYLLQGLAYCNLRDYPASEEAYTHGIEIAPDFVALHALRAEVRIRQGDPLGSAEDIAFIMQSDQADMFAPVLADASAGQWNCEQFFDYDYGKKP